MEVYVEMLGDYFRSLGFRLTGQTVVLWLIGIALLAFVIAMRVRFRESRKLVLLTFLYLLPEMLYRPLTGFSDSIFTVGKLLFWGTLVLIVALLSTLCWYVGFRLKSGKAAKGLAVAAVAARIGNIVFYFLLLKPALESRTLVAELSVLYHVLSYLPFVLLFFLLLERYQVAKREHLFSGSDRHFRSYWSDEQS